jgi:hypothetical protein
MITVGETVMVCEGGGRKHKTINNNIEAVLWMELARDRDRWRALVSTVKNLRVP